MIDYSRPFLEESDEPAFQFKSYFRYSQVRTSEQGDDVCDTFGTRTKGSTSSESFIRSVIVLLFYLVFIITFPISAWFCLKKIKALERCIIFRLGSRLPLRGPGLVVTFPCIDIVNVIDLNPHEVTVIEQTQLLTNDGSVIEVTGFKVVMTVSNVIRSFTQLQDSQQNVEQFIKLGFTNLIASSHVEDIERKLDWMVKEFIENSNQYLMKWGWEVMSQQLPRITVVSRAEPVNPLLSALKSYFHFGEADDDAAAKEATTSLSDTKTMSETIEKMQETDCSCPDDEVESDVFLRPLQSMANKYASLNMFGYKLISICVKIGDGPENFYQFVSKTGKIVKTDTMDEKEVHLKVSAKSMEDFLEFIRTEDTSKVDIQKSLF